MNLYAGSQLVQAATRLASDTTNTSSIFSHDDDNYDARIKEIEEYYIKTLLAEENEMEPLGAERFPTSKQQLDPAVLALQQPADGIYGPGWGAGEPVWGGEWSGLGAANAEPSLEVAINSHYRPANGILPLTPENLALLQHPSEEPSAQGEQAHSRRRTFAPVQSPAPPPPQQQPQPSQEKVNKMLYKTELCESFATTGACKYDNKCQFAHGLHELKFKERSDKFRTKPCINWSKTGYCRYGKRCCFKHGDDDDIMVYLKAGLIKPSADELKLKANKAPEGATKNKKNLHANVKILQSMAW
ncbi:AGR044Cp [Eremothecium gossypii ATCC 10895]|uniref:AGR044Cp n=1 Tax=Eremothecium gossypii (strain ATCC 10895 / CBS 109.51 / FGSC 9923 / NRRL Y-1056) TaxID=284811 RepID=Q750B3_EREGS|nr:AGR044Cp [Eremothecium gossypii ATCC 10895]AAS54533.1 AGR044Cp [Eremothecium gossypii ATCC 10895]AEY98865.1 FAGR044Cp [Eremothecium gossypii FDAG1]